MRVVIAGGHGKVARILARQLIAAGHTPTSLVRNAAHQDELARDGAQAAVFDLEHDGLDALTELLHGADAAVFAAGAGGGSTPERTNAVDREGAILFAQAAKQSGVPRLVILSGAGVDDYDPSSKDSFQVYCHAKSDADAFVRTLDIGWVIVRPDGLTDEPGNRLFTVADQVTRQGIARSDVAAILLELAVGPDPGRIQFEVTSGDQPLRAALQAL